MPNLKGFVLFWGYFKFQGQFLFLGRLIWEYQVGGLELCSN